MSQTIGNLTARLRNFAAAVEAKATVEDVNAKIELAGKATTAAEVAQLHRILSCFPEDLELAVLTALVGAIARSVYLTSDTAGDAVVKELPPALLTEAGFDVPRLPAPANDPEAPSAA